MKATCYDTGKVIFNTRGDASDAMATIRQIVKRKDDDGKRIKHRLLKPRPRRIYYCAYCDGYHLTSWS